MARKKPRTSKPTNSKPTSQQGKAKPAAAGPIQFDWRKHWSKKVKPHLQNPFVQFALDLGMRMYDPGWRSGDAPYVYGAISVDFMREPRKGTLRWYRPIGRCHYIALFSMVLGVILHPELTWRFVVGKWHTVPVGYNMLGQPRVVMDILLSDEYTAERSIEYAQEEPDEPSPGWQAAYQMFETDVAAAVREALADKDGHPPEQYLKSLLKRMREQSEVHSSGGVPAGIVSPPANGV